MQKVSLSIIIVFSLFPSQLSAEVVDDLRMHWQEDSRSIVSAELELRVLRSRALPGKTVNEFTQIIEELGENPTPKLIGAALTPLVDRGQAEVWRIVDWIVEGDKIRETIQSEGEPVATSVFDGRQRIDVLHQNRQISIGAPSISPTIPLDSLYFVPTVELKVWSAVESGTSIRLETSGGRMIVAESGFVKSLRAKSQQIYQYGPNEYPGGVLFPSAAIRVQANKDGTIRRVFAYVVDNVSFNKTIDDQTFVVKGEAGDKVFDYRPEPSNPIGRHLANDLEDITEFEPQTDLVLQSELAKGIGHYIPGMLVTCFIGIMFVRFKMS